MKFKANWLELHLGASNWCMHHKVRGHTTKSNQEKEGRSCTRRSLAIHDPKTSERSAALVSSLAREAGKCSFRYVFYHSVFQ